LSRTATISATLPIPLKQALAIPDKRLKSETFPQHARGKLGNTSIPTAKTLKSLGFKMPAGL
jgi:hypothetical protein